MTFNELVAEVLGIVKRPDMMARIRSAVREATRKAHASNFFYKDIHETGVQFDEYRYIQNFDPRQIYPRFRKTRYIRLWNYSDGTQPVGPYSPYYMNSPNYMWGNPLVNSPGGQFGGPGEFLTAIDTSSALDNYGYTKLNVYYMAGQLLQIRARCAIKYLLFGAYLYPDVGTEENPDTYNSWIADSLPGAIYHEAARIILQSIGHTELASAQAQLVAEAYQLLTIDSSDTPGI